MRKIFITGLLISMLIATVGMVIAIKPDVSYEVIPSNGHAQAFIPERAIEVSPGIFDLGLAIDDDGRIVEGLLFIHDKQEVSHIRRKPTPGGNCYEFLARGTKWKNNENYIVDPSNNIGLDEQFIRDNIAYDIQKFEDVSADILGNEDLTGIVDRTNIGNLNGNNEVIFSNLGATNTIAYTVVWGIFSGSPKDRILVEWDMVFNENFAWSSNGDVDKMDFESIATHELGHAMGLGHPKDTCTEETMYAYASYGETKKRDLNVGDFEGINKLYN